MKLSLWIGLTAVFLGLASVPVTLMTESMAQGNFHLTALWAIAVVAIALFQHWATERFGPKPRAVLHAIDKKHSTKSAFVFTLSTNNEPRLFSTPSDAPKSDLKIALEGCQSLRDFLGLFPHCQTWNGWNLFAVLASSAARPEHVILIGTSGERGSASSVEPMALLIKKFFPTAEIFKVTSSTGDHSVVRWSDQSASAIDSEKLDSLEAAFEACLEFFRRKRVSEKSICFDVSSGPRLAPIAAIKQTINLPVHFSLVSTTELSSGKPEGDVVSFFDLQVPTSS